MKISELVEAYIKLRDRKAQIKAEYDGKVALVQEKIDKIEAVLLKAFQDTGMESVKTEAGTAYKTTRSTASVADRDVFMQYVVQNGEWPLLEVRCSKQAVEQYKAANEELPPGITWREEVVVNVRRTA